MPATGTSATITGLSAGTTYQVQVRAGSDEGNGAWSAPGSGATEALPVVTIAAAAGGESVTEGADAQFTLSRTGTPGAALAVAVSVTEKGAFLDGTPPETVTFAMGATTTTLTVATAADYDLGERRVGDGGGEAGRGLHGRHAGHGHRGGCSTTRWRWTWR